MILMRIMKKSMSSEIQGRQSELRRTKSRSSAKALQMTDERLRRLLTHGGRSLDDRELLELMVSLAGGERIAAGQTAHNLLREFGDLSGALAAKVQRLVDIEGTTLAAIASMKVAEALAQRFAHDRMARVPVVLAELSSVVEYVRTVMAFDPVMKVRVFFLDRRHSMIVDEEVASGSVNHVRFYNREVARRALELEAAGIILARNLPQDDAIAQPYDIHRAKELQRALYPLGVDLHDYVIVGRAGHFSLSVNGLLRSASLDLRYAPEQ